MMFYDISHVDLEFNIPEIKDRYYVWPFYDMYANNFCNIGSVDQNSPGKYLLTYGSNNFGLQTQQINNTYQGYVNSPTPYGIIIVRIEAFNPTTDIANILEINKNVTVVPQNRSIASGVPALDTGIFANIINSSAMLAEKVLNLTAQLAPYNQPEVLSDRGWVNASLTDAGISGSNNTFSQPDGTNLTLAAATANASAANLPLEAGFDLTFGNNWTSYAPQISGDFRSYYNARQLIAQHGYLQLTADQAIYPTYSSGDLYIGPKEAYLFTYSAKPETKQNGFWSLTVYGADQFLVPNNASVYALGNRNTLTYPDGQLVYGSNGTIASGNGAFQILLQPADVRPPSNWTSNWLPAPSGGGNWSVNFRIYAAEDSMTNGSWVYPTVQKVAAITT